MIKTLNFSAQTSIIQLPSITAGIPANHGIQLKLWIRRTGTAARQRIVELGNDSGRLILGTGDQQGSLRLTVVQGTTRNEIVTLAALPIGRWVQVTASLGFGISRCFLSVAGKQVANGALTAVLSGALTKCFIGGGSGGIPFEGSLSQLEISFTPLIGSAKVWASYPLQQTVFDHTEQTASGPVDYHRVDDAGPNNRDGMVRGALPSSEYASLDPEPVPVLQMDGTGAELRLSPISQLAGELTLEAWVCPSDATKRQVVLRLGELVPMPIPHGNPIPRELVLCVGGSNKELSLMLVEGPVGFILCTVPNAVESDTFKHIAVVLKRRGGPGTSPTDITLYLQGQGIKTATIPRPDLSIDRTGWFDRDRALDALLQAQSLPVWTISGHEELMKLTSDALVSLSSLSPPLDIVPLRMFTGRIAELRLWKGAMDDATLDARFLKRLVGNEPTLAANYRLEQAVDGIVHDLSAMRGLGKFPGGSRIVSTTSLPLLPTRGDIYLDVKGKLVTETILYNKGNLTAQRFNGQVFDATVVARRDSTGTTLGGSTLQITPDADVTVFLPFGNTIQQTRWIAGLTYSFILSLDGRIRLRFLATDLTFPTLRVRVDAMPPGLWTMLRPDRESLTKLGSLKSSELLSPPQGKPSPLRAGATNADAEACADALNQLTSLCGPRASRSSSETTTRAFYDPIVSAVEYVADQGESVVNGMIKLGASAGAYAGALIDNGTAALGSVSSTAASVTSLVVSGVQSGFIDLVSAASRATARYGKSAIESCIQSANTLAVVATGAVGQISHTLALIGTTIIDGVTYVWRVVCAGVMDAFDAVKSFLKKIAADIQMFIEFLAWLFDWGDFLAASDAIYDDMREILDGLPARVSSLGQYRSQLNQFVTLPSSVGNKSLAELCHVRIPEVPSFEEVEYITELVDQLFDTSSLPIGGVDSFVGALSSTTQGLDVSSLEGLLGSNPSGVAERFTDPVQLVSTPVQALFNNLLTGSSNTTVIDFVYDKLIPAAGTALSGLSSALTSHISVSGVTDLLELIMGGRELNLLRAASFIAAIVQVLTKKISASARSQSTVQPVSYSSAEQGREAAAAAGFAFGFLFAIVEGLRAYLESKATPTSSKILRIKLDALLGIILMGRAGCAFGMLQGRSDSIQKALGAQATVEMFAGLGEFAMSSCRLLTALGEVAHLVYQVILTGLSAGFAGWAADVGVCTTDADWAVFGLSVGGVIFAQVSTVIGLALDHKSGSAGKVIPALQIGFGVVATVCDVAALGTELAS